MRRPSTLLGRYSIAGLLVAACLGIRLSFDWLLGTTVPYLQFFPAIMLAAWLGGLGPGLLATALAALSSAYFFLAPIYSFAIASVADSVSLPIFVGVGVAMVVVIDSLRRAEALQRQHAQLATQRARDLAEAADAISATRRRLADVVANVPGVVWEAWGRPDGTSQRTDFVSDYARVMVGYEPHEWTSTENFWLTIVHPDDRERAAAEAAAIYARRGSGRIEFRWVHRDGRVIWVEGHCHVVLGDDGQPIGMRGVTLDVSERKQLERERADLLQRERSARADADAANRLKDDFLATLSHELRTPLNAILGYVRMLRGNVFDDSRREKALEVVERNAATLTQMVEDVLDVSRIVLGKIRLNVQPVDIRRVIEEAVASVKPAADARGVALQMMLERDVAPVTGDGERLQQVIWNLMSNAVKFTPRNGRVQVRLTRVDSCAEIVVTDSGAGISPEFLPHVFERFRQADSRFAREHGGLGLGLAIAREIVHLHGGSIEAASDGEGKGATFTVKLPLMRDSGSGMRDPRDLATNSSLVIRDSAS